MIKDKNQCSHCGHERTMHSLPSDSAICTGGCGCVIFDPSISYEGCVLRVEHGQTWTFDPICWSQAHVWTGSEIVTVDLRHDYTNANREANVDATAEVREAAIAWRALALVPKVHAEDFRCWAAQVELDHEVRKGVVIEVVLGRKIRHGVQGTVFWVGDDQFSPAWQHRPKRVGFVTDDGTKLYTAITNVAVVDADPPALSEYTSTDEEALVVATEEARRELNS